ncbi:MAG TPA: glycosyltransferase [Gaiellaceae bacterium]|nr:glycosyltransferase [Gaiellaceae bacterium]
MSRALLVSASARPGGAERGFLALARRLPEHGWETTAVVLEDGPLREWLGADGILLTAGRTRQLHRTARTIRALARLARDADAVVSSLSKTHVYGGAAAALARVPAVWWQRDTAHGTRVERAAARVPAAAVVCSSGPAADAQRRLTPRRRVEVIPPGVDLAVVERRDGDAAALRAHLGWEGLPVVGIVGRLQPWKGQEAFLHAAAAVAAQEPSARFVLVGGAILGWEGDYPERLRRLAAELGLAERVHFTGHVEDALPWYSLLDVLVHASETEPFGRVLVEALALGIPVVSVDEGAPTEIVEDGVSGLLVERRPEALAGGVVRVLRDRALAGRLAAAGPERARRFDASRTAAGFATLLDSLAGRAER